MANMSAKRAWWQRHIEQRKRAKEARKDRDLERAAYAQDERNPNLYVRQTDRPPIDAAGKPRSNGKWQLLAVIRARREMLWETRIAMASAVKRQLELEGFYVTRHWDTLSVYRRPVE